jgi:hypothetical protein
MSKGAILGLVFALAVGLLIFMAIRGLNEVTCEVCVTFNGETVCRTGSARSREDAIETAQRSCCAVLSSGMTESIQCQATTPDRVSCD